MEQQGERLQKVLARAGVGSRRAVEELIVAGRVKVNGKQARLGQRADVSRDVVEVDGSVVPLATDQVTYLLNKPAGVVSTVTDPYGRTTSADLLDVPHRVFPVGRLDVETEGALLLTNDGELTLRLTHPRFGVPKTYLAEASGSVGKRAALRLAEGIELEDGMTLPAEVMVIERGPASTLVEITIHEGRNRQVRRMFDALGHPLKRLVRTGIGNITLGHLKVGRSRRLAPLEVAGLYASARRDKET